jgi:hypothetical protein
MLIENGKFMLGKRSKQNLQRMAKKELQSIIIELMRRK